MSESGSSRTALLLGAVAVGSSLATLGSVLGMQYVWRCERRRQLKERVSHEADQLSSPLPRADSNKPAAQDGGRRAGAHVPMPPAPPPADAFDEQLVREQLSRNYGFLGEDGMHAIRNSFVVVVGAGGVGSWAALMLLRSGVSHLRLIDFDQVSLSSLNRHACATLADVGRPKVRCCAEYFARIAPWAKVEACVELFSGQEADRLLAGRPTYVLDAIDNLSTKVDLLRYCYEHQLRVISSMGAGAKADPSRIQLSDISTTVEDPLARAVRRELRALGIPPIVSGNVAAPASKGPKKGKEAPGHVEGQGGQGGRPSKDSNAGQPSQPGESSTPDEAAKQPAGKPDGNPATEAPDRRAKPSEKPAQPSLDAPPRDAATTRRSSTGSAMDRFYSPNPSPDPQREDAVSEEPAQLPPPEAEAPPAPSAEPHGVSAPAPSDAAAEQANGAADGAPPRALAESQEASAAALAGAEAPADGPAHADSPAASDPLDQPWTIPCVYSTEKSDTRLLPLPEDQVEKGYVHELAAFEDFRVRILPVLGPLPAMFGLAAATYILCDLAKHRIEPLAVKGRRKLYEKLFSDLNVVESRYPSPEGAQTRSATPHDVPPTYQADSAPGRGPPPRIRIPFSVNDCAYVFEEVFRGRTVVPPFESLANGQLMRWDSQRPLDYDNVALFDRRQAREHEQKVLKEHAAPEQVWGERTAAMVQKRLAEERRMSRWR